MRSVPREAWKALFAAQLGWMLDATDFLLFTYALRAIQPEFGLSDGSMAALVSIALIAGALGGVTFGTLADRVGRVRAMTISMLFYSLATAGLATSNSFLALAVWRFLVGSEWVASGPAVPSSWPKPGQRNTARRRSESCNRDGRSEHSSRQECPRCCSSDSVGAYFF